MELLGNILIGLGAVFMLFGIVGIFKYKCFYLRILIAAKIDTVGALTVILGVVIRHGFSFFSARTLLLLVFMLIVNPMVTYFIVHFAHASGHEPLASKDNLAD